MPQNGVGENGELYDTLVARGTSNGTEGEVTWQLIQAALKMKNPIFFTPHLPAFALLKGDSPDMEIIEEWLQGFEMLTEEY